MFMSKYNELFEKANKYIIEKNAISFIFSNNKEKNELVDKYYEVTKNDGIILSKTQNSIILQSYQKSQI